MTLFLIFMLSFIQPTGSVECPNNGQFYSKLSVCYWRDTTPADFDTAQGICETYGGMLAKIPDSDALAFIDTSLMLSPHWIGVRTADYITFTYMDGEEASYLPWATGKFSGNGRCVQLQTNARPLTFIDVICAFEIAFLCSKKIVVTTQTSTEAITSLGTTHITSTPTDNNVETTSIAPITSDGRTSNNSTTCECICETVPTLSETKKREMMIENLQNIIEMLTNVDTSIENFITCDKTTKCILPMSATAFRSCILTIR